VGCCPQVCLSASSSVHEISYAGAKHPLGGLTVMTRWSPLKSTVRAGQGLVAGREGTGRSCGGFGFDGDVWGGQTTGKGGELSDIGWLDSYEHGSFM